RTRLEPYTAEQYRADLSRVTDGRADPLLARLLTEESWPTIEWLRRVGLRFRLMYERQSYRSGDTEQFWGGLAIGTVDGGKGLVAQHFDAAKHRGIEFATGRRLIGLESRGDCVDLIFRTTDGEDRISVAAAV